MAFFFAFAAVGNNREQPVQAGTRTEWRHHGTWARIKVPLLLLLLRRVAQRTLHPRVLRFDESSTRRSIVVIVTSIIISRACRKLNTRLVVPYYFDDGACVYAVFFSFSSLLITTTIYLQLRCARVCTLCRN